MGFGFSKAFTIFLFLSIALAIGSKNWKNGAVLMGIFAVCMIVWRLFTK